MFDIHKFAESLVNPKERLSVRAMVLVIIVMVAILADRTFKFSDNVIDNQKLDQVAKIEQLLANEKLEARNWKRVCESSFRRWKSK